MRVLLVVSDPREVRVAQTALTIRQHVVTTVSPNELDRAAPVTRERFDLLVVETSLVDHAELRERLSVTSPALEVITIGNAESADERADIVAHLPSPRDQDRLLAVTDEISATVGDTQLRDPDDLVSNETVFAGDSPAIQRLAEHVDLVAQSDSPLCVFGEDGSGRWIVARAIHDRGPRRHRRFVAINAAAHSDGELHQRLFGGEHCATVAAAGGTLFIDRLAMIGNATQRKLLHHLQHAGEPPIVRVIAGVRSDPTMFGVPNVLPDLYFRIKVLEVEIPPLRDRTQDLPQIVGHMLGRLRGGAAPATIAPETMRSLQRYGFPGNLIELAHALIHAALVAQGAAIRPEHVPASIRQQEAEPTIAIEELASLDQVVKRFERD
nr:sigma-54-dependent Fis family transcriptional regulator [Deltaproteobacteria bacterium]